MARSQNGWPVVGREAVTDRALFGVEFPNGWLQGDVDVVFTYLIGRLHREVEPLDNGGCWGWFVKNIEGSDTISNHASATAFDYNAPAHPMGVRNTYSAAKRAKIRAILADLRGVVRWGGDYTGRPDDMHFEINDTRAAVHAVAEWIKGEDMDPEDFAKALLAQKVKVGDESWTVGACIGYLARKAYETDLNTERSLAEAQLTNVKLDAMLAALVALGESQGEAR